MRLPSARKAERLRETLRGFLGVERPPSEHGLRLLALEALHRGEVAPGLLLADAATDLPPEVVARLALLGLREAVERAREAFLAPVPLRPRAPRVEVQAKALGKVLGVLAGAAAGGLLPKPVDHYRKLLGWFVDEADARLLAVYVKEGLRLYGRYGEDGGVLVDPRFFRGLEDFMELLPLFRGLYGRGRELASLLEV